ncbi:LLM class flavin-dependent oxidoreductase [Pseudonocardia xishanensis]|uniref:LLM class flavin-dependent oxidoreductase n=1 Tax=Pseudonocardia xishanensis TaxID=630995 RepID=A0ABP8RIB2_9PSEU
MTEIQLSCAFATAADSPEHIQVAEELGYRRAWLYDVPQQGPDVWLALALAAQRTTRIGLGPGVLVPSLRHPMVNATQTLSLQAMAPGRVAVAFGTGFSGRAAMGAKPLPWAFMGRYITAYQGLLRGETVEWEEARMRLLPPEPDAAGLPPVPPILVAALGPKGAACARAVGADGIFAVGAPPAAAAEHRWVALLVGGTVLDPDEDPTGPRVQEAAGPTWAITYHFPYTLGGPVALNDVPGGRAWVDVVERTPAPDRHHAVHQGHLVRLTDADRAAWDAGGAALLTGTTLTGSPAHVGAAVAGLAERGVTEIVFQPSGPDVRRELTAFRDAVRATVPA